MDAIAILIMSSAPWPLGPHLPNHSSSYAIYNKVIGSGGAGKVSALPLFKYLCILLPYSEYIGIHMS